MLIAYQFTMYYKNVKHEYRPRGFRFSREGDRTTHDEKFFELFSLAMYIHIVMFFVLKSIMKIVKAFCLVLYYVYIVFFSDGVFLFLSLSILSI